MELPMQNIGLKVDNIYSLTATVLAAASVVLFCVYFLTAYYSAPLADALYFLGDTLKPETALWEQFGEQRPIIMRLLFRMDVAFVNGSGILPVAFSILALTATVTLTVSILFQTQFPSSMRILTSALVVVLMTRTYGLETYIWAHGAQFILVTALATGACAALILPHPRNGISLAVATLLGLLASATYGNGLIVWPLLAIILFLQRAGFRAFLVPLTLGCIVVAFFSFGYTIPKEQSDPLGALFRPLDVIWYVLHFLGVPWSRYPVIGPIGIGVSGAVLLIWLWAIFAVWKRWSKQGSDAADLMCFAMLTFSVGSALMAALARVDFGSMQAIQSRYAPFAMMGHAGASIFLLSRLQEKFHLAARIAVIAFLCLMPVEQVVGGEIFRWEAQTLDEVKLALLAGSREDFRLRQIYPYPEDAREILNLAKARGISLFRQPGASMVGKLISPLPPLPCDGEIEAIWHRRGSEWEAVGWMTERGTRQLPVAVLIADTDNRVIGFGLINQKRRELPVRQGWHAYVVPGKILAGWTAIGLLRDGSMCTVIRKETGERVH